MGHLVVLHYPKFLHTLLGTQVSICVLAAPLKIKSICYAFIWARVLALIVVLCSRCKIKRSSLLFPSANLKNYFPLASIISNNFSRARISSACSLLLPIPRRAFFKPLSNLHDFSIECSCVHLKCIPHAYVRNNSCQASDLS
jgi:hypothetical protein